MQNKSGSKEECNIASKVGFTELPIKKCDHLIRVLVESFHPFDTLVFLVVFV